MRVPAVKWADELQIFFQADINKAALRGAYAVDSVALPEGAAPHLHPPARPAQCPGGRLVVVQQGN